MADIYVDQLYGNIIDDNTPSISKTYSSQKIQFELDEKSDRVTTGVANDILKRDANGHPVSTGISIDGVALAGHNHPADQVVLDDTNFGGVLSQGIGNLQEFADFVDDNIGFGAQIIVDTVDPTTEGKNGDIFINSVSFDVFRKDTIWFLVGNIKGEQGDQGDPGIQGPPGPQGNPGVDGDDGVNGRSVVSIVRTSGDGSPGSIDTYTITYSSAPLTSTFDVYNGANGTGSGDFMADGSVPMTGDLNLNSNDIINVKTIDLDTTPGAVSNVEGRIAWNETDKCIDVYDGTTRLQLGQEGHETCLNNTLSTIADGVPVYISGYSTGRLTIALAKADDPITSDRIIGITTQAIPAGQEGKITWRGWVNNINTLGRTAGAPIYLSATTAGEYTETQPLSPNYVVHLGHIGAVDAVNGNIYVDISVITQTADSVRLDAGDGVQEMNNMQDFFRHSFSTGITDGCDITNNGNGTVNIDVGEGEFRHTTADDGELMAHVINSATNITPANNDVSYLYVDYNGGSPIWVVTQNLTDFDGLTKVVGYKIARDGNNLSIIDLKKINVDSNRKLRRLLAEWDGYSYGGFYRSHLGVSVISHTGTRNISVGTGKYIHWLNEFTHSAFNTSTGSTYTRFYNRSAYTSTSALTQVDNTNYDNDGILTALGTNKHRADDWFIVLGTSPYLCKIMGNAQYNAESDARNSPFPTILPGQIDGVAVYLGRTTIKEGATSFLAYPAGSLSLTTGTPSDINAIGGTPLTIANGGTGSTTQNFVDLSTAQTVAGAKKFTSSVKVDTASGAYDANLYSNAIQWTRGAQNYIDATSVGGTINFRTTTSTATDTLVATISKDNATFNKPVIVPASTYGAGWNGSNEVPTKNDVYDKIESLGTGAVSTTTTTFTAGEALTAGNAVRMGVAGLSPILQNSGGTGDAGSGIGNSTTNWEMGQGVNFSGSIIYNASFFLRRIGTGLGESISLTAYSDAGFTTVIGRSINSYSQGSIATTFTEYPFYFSGISATGNIYFKLTKSSVSSSGTNYVQAEYANTSVYAGGTAYRLNNSGTVTALATNDLRFKINGGGSDEVATKVYKASAQEAYRCKIIGYANSTVSADASVNINTGGIDGNQSGLTIGSTYYLTDTAGTIGLVPGTTVSKVGQAISATQLLISSNELVSTAIGTRTITTTGTVTYSHMLGKIPRLIQIDGITTKSGTSVATISSGSWTQLGNRCAYGQVNSISGTTAASFSIIGMETSSIYNTGVIQNVTDNSFDIVWTATGSTTATWTLGFNATLFG